MTSRYYFAMSEFPKFSAGQFRQMKSQNRWNFPDYGSCYFFMVLKVRFLNVLIMVEDVGEKCMKLYVGNFTNIQLHQHSENSRPTHFLSPTYFTNVYSPFFLHTVPWWFWTNLFDMSWYDFISRHSCWPFRWRILLLIIYIGKYHVLLFAENSFY